MLADSLRQAGSLLALLCALASPAAAGDRQVVEVEGVRCGGTYSGPELLNHGYFPVEIDLWNTTTGSVVVEIEAQQQWGEEDRIRRRVRLEPGERSSFEPLLRARSGGYNVYNVLFSVSGEESVVSLGPAEWSTGIETCVMFYAASAPEAGAVERWTEEWTQASAGAPAPAPTVVGPGITFGSPSSGREFSLGAGTFEDLSGEWSAYTSLDAVVLSVDEGLPPPEKLEALLAWARTGGQLIVSGREPRAALARSGRELGWLTPDYELDVELEGGVFYHCGQGLLGLLESHAGGAQVMETHLIGGSSAFEAVESLEDLGNTTWHPAGHVAGAPRMQAVVGQLEGFGDLSLRGLMVLLVLFALLMGPVNFLWVKRSKKPMLLLATVPGISILTSVALVIYGILSQGLDVKVTTQSYTFLDQLNHSATTAEVRRLFAGSSPGEGLRPAQGTAVFPDQYSWSGGFRNARLFTRNLDQGRLLGGDFLPVRRPVVQLLLSDHATRLRLGVSAVGESLEVSNALGGPIEKLLLRDARGRYHHLEGTLGAGASRRLVAGASLGERDAWRATLDLFWGVGADKQGEIPPGSYLAEFDSDGFRDACGVPMTKLSGRDFVFGVYAAAEEGEL